MGELSGKVAIVTGASKGIGAAIARRFAEAGAAVAVNYASGKADADQVVDAIVRKGGKAVAIQANVGKSADVKRLFAETKAKLGTPSILVNNAGVFTFGPLEAVTEEDFHRQFDTNVLGTILATREAVSAFNGQGGSVINLSTISSVDPVPNSLVYSASKSAIELDHQGVGAGTGRSQNPRQRDRARHDRDRGAKAIGHHVRDRESHRTAHSSGAARSAGRHCAGGAVPRLGPVIVADRRTHFRLGRAVIARRAFCWVKAAPAKSAAPAKAGAARIFSDLGGIGLTVRTSPYIGR